MREIKFRIPTKCHNDHFRWEYIEVDFPEDGAVKREWGQKNCDCPTHGIDQGFMSVGQAQQYIGLKDKNGKEICEGDVVCYVDEVVVDVIGGYERTEPEGQIYQVEWQDGGWFINGDMLWEYASDCEIIGNIYENPYLLPVKE